MTPTVSLNLYSGTSYMERLLRDGGDLDSMDRSLFDTDVSLIFLHLFIIKTYLRQLFLVSVKKYFVNMS